MQSYNGNTQESNIFQQIRDWRANRATRITSKEVDKISSLRSDKTHSDEALFVIKCILVFVTIFTSYCAYLFYFNTFSKIFDPYPAWLGAVGLALVTEAAKIFLLHRFLRSVFFGWIAADWWSLGGWLFIGALAIGAYCWSVKISTDGMNMLATQMGEDATPKADLTLQIRTATADIDQQIKSAQSSQSEAMGTKWKGKTTWRAQKIAGKNADAIASLQEQRKEVVRQTMENYNYGSQHREKSINSYADWIRKYGGYMEWVAAVAIFSIVFFERRLVFHFHKYTPPTYNDDWQNSKKRNFDDHQPSHSPIGFNVDQTGNVRQAARPVNGPPPPSPNLYHNVPQENTTQAIVGSDEAIKHYRTLLGREVANLKNENGRAHTITERMNKNLIQFGRVVQSKGFDPKKAVATEMFIFLEAVFTTMNDHRRPYKYADALMKDFYPFIDPEEYATRKQEQPQA